MIPCQPLLVTVLGSTAEDQARYKETFLLTAKYMKILKVKHFVVEQTWAAILPLTA